MHPSFHLMNPSAHNVLLNNLYILVHHSSIICFSSYLLIHTFTQALSLIQQISELLLCVRLAPALRTWWRQHSRFQCLRAEAPEASHLFHNTRNTYCIGCTQRPYIQWLLISLPWPHNLLISFRYLCSLFSSFPPSSTLLFYPLCLYTEFRAFLPRQKIDDHSDFGIKPTWVESQLLY